MSQAYMPLLYSNAFNINPLKTSIIFALYPPLARGVKRFLKIFLLLVIVCIRKFVEVTIFKGEVQKHGNPPMGFLKSSKAIQHYFMTREGDLTSPFNLVDTENTLYCELHHHILV